MEQQYSRLGSTSSGGHREFIATIPIARPAVRIGKAVSLKAIDRLLRIVVDFLIDRFIELREQALLKSEIVFKAADLT